MKVTKITNEKQKTKAIQKGNKVLTASELAIEKPFVYAKKMQEMKKNEGLPINTHNDSIVKVFYHVDKLLTLMDTLVDEGAFVQNVKAKAKLFVKELESYNNKIYSVSETGQKQVGDLINEQEEIYDLISETHNIYYPDLLEILKKYNETRSKEAVIKTILNNQYALFKDFEIPDIVKKQCKRIDENCESYNILHLAEVITREKVLALKQLNPKTLEVLDKMFRNAQIKW